MRRRKVCAFCVEKVTHIDYKEIDKIRRFVSERLLERRNRLNGIPEPSGDRRRGDVASAFKEFRLRSSDPKQWPPNKKELAKLGDSSAGINFGPNDAEGKVYGIDFGLREWVEDLPLIPGPDSFSLISFLVQSHLSNVGMPADRRSRPWGDRLPEIVKKLGVIRGLGFGEPRLPNSSDPISDLYLRNCHKPKLTANFGDPGLLGVRRAQHVDRGGAGLSRGTHPLISVTGFRIAGTARLVELVRKEGR